jgi:hypothetical protein
VRLEEDLESTAGKAGVDDDAGPIGVGEPWGTGREDAEQQRFTVLQDA